VCWKEDAQLAASELQKETAIEVSTKKNNDL